MGLPQSSIIKLLIVAVALSVAHAAARHIQNEEEKIINLNQYLDNMKAKVNQDVAAIMNHQHLPVQARTLLERQQAEMQKAQHQMKEMLSEAERSLHSAMKEMRSKFEQMVQKVMKTDS